MPRCSCCSPIERCLDPIWISLIDESDGEDVVDLELQLDCGFRRQIVERDDASIDLVSAGIIAGDRGHECAVGSCGPELPLLSFAEYSRPNCVLVIFYRRVVGKRSRERFALSVDGASVSGAAEPAPDPTTVVEAMPQNVQAFVLLLLTETDLPEHEAEFAQPVANYIRIAQTVLRDRWSITDLDGDIGWTQGSESFLIGQVVAHEHRCRGINPVP